MNRRIAIPGLAALALAACTPTERPGGPIAIESDSITYSTGPCFGACPVYWVTVRPDGSGVFNGIRFTKVTGKREFTLTPDQYRAFAKAVAPYRPETGERRIAPGEPGCKQVATDLPSVDIQWTRAIGDSQHLYVYFGCDMEKNAPMNDALGNAPDVLPIEALIGGQP